MLAFLNTDNDLVPFVIQGRVDSQAVIAYFDAFSRTLTKKTFIILDNAPVHKSKLFLSHLPNWAKHGLILKFLPPYCPELNLIEILWRKIKYEWMPLTAYLFQDATGSC